MLAKERTGGLVEDRHRAGPWLWFVVRCMSRCLSECEYRRFGSTVYLVSRGTFSTCEAQPSARPLHISIGREKCKSPVVRISVCWGHGEQGRDHQRGPGRSGSDHEAVRPRRHRAGVLLLASSPPGGA